MIATLPPAPWNQRKDLARLVAALGPGNARYVGGAVRDTLLGLAVKDIDLATPLPPGEVMRPARRSENRPRPYRHRARHDDRDPARGPGRDHHAAA